MSDSVVETNIPVRRMPFAAGTVPPNVPYMEGDDVGSGVQPVFVSGRKVTPSNENVGDERVNIYLKNGQLRKGVGIQTIESNINKGTLIATVTEPDGSTTEIFAPGSSADTFVQQLKLPILTPMWFDHMTKDTDMWVPAMTYTYNSSGVDGPELKEAAWPTYTVAETGKGQYYKEIWKHLVGDGTSSNYGDWGNPNSGTYLTDTYTLSDGKIISIPYRRAADGHKLVRQNDVLGAGVPTMKASSTSNPGNISYEAALNYIYNDDAIGAAWYIMIEDYNNRKFRLPRTKYGFHGTKSLVKRLHPENCDNVNMRLYFSTGMSVEDTTTQVQSVTVTPRDAGFPILEQICQIDVTVDGHNVSKVIKAPRPDLEDFVFVDMNNNTTVKRICVVPYS